MNSEAQIMIGQISLTEPKQRVGWSRSQGDGFLECTMEEAIKFHLLETEGAIELSRIGGSGSRLSVCGKLEQQWKTAADRDEGVSLRQKKSECSYETQPSV
jgi:hypothetical protein